MRTGFTQRYNLQQRITLVLTEMEQNMEICSIRISSFVSNIAVAGETRIPKALSDWFKVRIYRRKLLKNRSSTIPHPLSRIQPGTASLKITTTDSMITTVSERFTVPWIKCCSESICGM